MKYKLLLEDTIINLQHIERMEKKGKSLVFYMISGAMFNCTFDDESIMNHVFNQVLAFGDAPSPGNLKKKWFT